jgi:hypothetical protein
MTYQQEARAVYGHGEIDELQERKDKVLGLRATVHRYLDIFSLLSPKIGQVLGVLKAESNDTASLGAVLHWLPQSFDFPRNGNRCYIAKALTSLLTCISALSWKIWEARNFPKAFTEVGFHSDIIIEDADVKAMLARMSIEATLSKNDENKYLHHNEETLDFYQKPGSWMNRQKAWGRLGSPSIGQRAPFLNINAIRQINFTATSRIGLRAAGFELPIIRYPVNMIDGQEVNTDPTINGVITRNNI